MNCIARHPHGANPFCGLSTASYLTCNQNIGCNAFAHVTNPPLRPLLRRTRRSLSVERVAALARGMKRDRWTALISR